MNTVAKLTQKQIEKLVYTRTRLTAVRLTHRWRTKSSSTLCLMKLSLTKERRKNEQRNCYTA